MFLLHAQFSIAILFNLFYLSILDVVALFNFEIGGLIQLFHFQIYPCIFIYTFVSFVLSCYLIYSFQFFSLKVWYSKVISHFSNFEFPQANSNFQILNTIPKFIGFNLFCL